MSIIFNPIQLAKDFEEYHKERGMPVLISDENYNEYRILQHNAVFQQKLDSIRATKNLKDDIDTPIRKLVAMFALLGCEPIWSCCGFDYEGQPMHKTHEYGNLYIRLTLNDCTIRVINKLHSEKIIKQLLFNITEIACADWVVWGDANFVQLDCDFDYWISEQGYPWSFSSCIHYYEYGVIKIYQMEEIVKRLFVDDFADEVTLKDSNKAQQTLIKNWQYPALEDWIITKEDIIK